MDPLAPQYPLVTFVSPCYNHERYVIQSLESIRQQTYPNIQHIIIDDCSKDRSPQIIEEWIRDTGYQCQFIRHETNRGVSYSLNEGIRLAKGEFWTALATDDYIIPERTEHFVRYLQANPSTAMVVSDTLMVDQDSNPVAIDGTTSFLQHYAKFNPKFSWENFGTYESLLYGNYIPGSQMIRTKVYDVVGGYPEHFKLEDWDTWLRMTRLGPIGLIREPLTHYRWHPGNTVSPANRKSMLTNVVQTILSQKDYCYSNGMREEFDKVYRYYFNTIFSPLRDRKNSLLFLTGNNFGLFVGSLLGKLGTVAGRKLRLTKDPS